MKNLMRSLFILSLAGSAPAGAQLAQYGYVVGTLEPGKSFLEKIDPLDKGKYLHYHIFLLTAANVEYEVVIDVNDVSPTKPLIYRVASLNSQNATTLASNFGPIFSATSDFHLISNMEPSYGPVLTPTEVQRRQAGALDYIRHQGLLTAIAGLPWQTTVAQTTSDPLQWALPVFDALFKPVSRNARLSVTTKVIVFGAPFTSGGHGMHVVHQNQADSGSTYSATNAPWQDGGVIVKRQTKVGQFTINSSNSILMTKFDNQSDFSAESNDLSLPAPAGHTIVPTSTSVQVGGVCGDTQSLGPFSASQVQVVTSGVSAFPYGPNSAPKIQIDVKRGPFTGVGDAGDFSLVDNAVDSTAKGRAFGRAYSPLQVRGVPWRAPSHLVVELQ